MQTQKIRLPNEHTLAAMSEGMCPHVPCGQRLDVEIGIVAAVDLAYTSEEVLVAGRCPTHGVFVLRKAGPKANITVLDWPDEPDGH